MGGGDTRRSPWLVRGPLPPSWTPSGLEGPPGDRLRPRWTLDKSLPATPGIQVPSRRRLRLTRGRDCGASFRGLRDEVRLQETSRDKRPTHAQRLDKVQGSSLCSAKCRRTGNSLCVVTHAELESRVDRRTRVCLGLRSVCLCGCAHVFRLQLGRVCARAPHACAPDGGGVLTPPLPSPREGRPGELARRARRRRGDRSGRRGRALLGAQSYSCF